MKEKKNKSNQFLTMALYINMCIWTVISVLSLSINHQGWFFISHLFTLLYLLILVVYKGLNKGELKK